MKLASYRTRGRGSFGMVVGEDAVDRAARGGVCMPREPGDIMVMGTAVNLSHSRVVAEV